VYASVNFDIFISETNTGYPLKGVGCQAIRPRTIPLGMNQNPLQAKSLQLVLFVRFSILIIRLFVITSAPLLTAFGRA